MSDSPYKPPTRPGSGGMHAPIPSVPVAARRHGAIPSAGVQLPRRPLDVGEIDDEAKQAEPPKSWAYQYRGNAGPMAPDNPSMPGGGGDDVIADEFPLKPAIDLPEARPLAVQFYQDTQTAQPTNVPTSQGYSSFYDDAGIEPDAGDFEFDRLRLDDTSEGGVMQPDAETIWIANSAAPGSPLVKTFLEENAPPFQIEIRYLRGGVGGAPCALRWTVNSWEEGLDDDVGFLSLSVTPLSSDRDQPMTSMDAIDIEVFGFQIPNAAVRARVRYRSGKSEVQFDCDWSGGFMVHADRLEISRVPFAPDTSRPYIDAPVEVSATVLADAPRPGGSISLTVPPVAVPRPTGERFYVFPIYALARRVNLLLKYGDDPDAPGDAPLGQIFVAFVGKYDQSLCYIDAMSAREALFGPGLPVPAGVSKLVVSNRSDDDSMRIGVVWRLEL